MTCSSAKNVTIIGAGLAGLTAGHLLSKNGFCVTLLEAENLPGGRMSERQINGLRLNTGARWIYSFSHEILDLVKQLDLLKHLQAAPKVPVFADVGGRAFKLRFGPDPRLLFDSLLTPIDKLRCLSLIPDLLRARFRVNPNQLLTAEQFDSESLTQYFAKKGLVRYAKYFVEPIFRGARCWNLADISPAFFLTTGAHMVGGHAYTFDQGIGLLSRTLSSRLNLVYGARVQDLVRLRSGGCRIRYTYNGQLVYREADLVLCAVEGAHLSSLIRDPRAEESSWFQAVRYSPGGVVHFGGQPRLSPMVRFIDNAASKRLSTIDIADEMTGAGSIQTRVSCYLSPEGVIKVRDQGLESQLTGFIQEDLPADVMTFCKSANAVVEQWIEHMLPVFYPGYLKKLKSFASYQADKRKHIYYAGDYMAQALVGGACRSGLEAAQTIIRHWGSN